MAVSSAANGGCVMSEYLVGIVGEASYQPAVRRCRAGQSVSIDPEPTNSYDPLALRVSAAGRTIGYIARDHWLQNAVHKQGKTLRATINEVTGLDRELQGIVLSVTVGDFQPAQGGQPRRGWLATLLFGRQR